MTLSACYLRSDLVMYSLPESSSKCNVAATFVVKWRKPTNEKFIFADREELKENISDFINKVQGKASKTVSKPKI
jgi:hypothetical protein